VYGHSSGAGLALRAAARGLPISRLVLHEPPYGPDDPESREGARKLAETVRTAIGEGRPGDAIRAFMGDAGLPPEVVEAMAGDAGMLALAPTMVYDHEVMGDFTDGGTIPEALVRRIAVPSLVLGGGMSPGFFEDAAARIAELLRDGRRAEIGGHGHDAPAGVVAPVVADFLLASTRTVT
jgi:pimeloyl-ACP methyl ester carboxylesterase